MQKIIDRRDVRKDLSFDRVATGSYFMAAGPLGYGLHLKQPLGCATLFFKGYEHAGSQPVQYVHTPTSKDFCNIEVVDVEIHVL